MDTLLVLLGLFFVLLGMVGSFLPVLPGPPVSWIGLLLLHLTEAVPMNYTLLGITLFVALLIFVMDYIIPAMGTKRFGGSRAGAIGTTIGLIVGIFAPIPFGILIGPFVGALIGELVFNKSETNVALKAAFGSFLGFLASTFMKFIVTVAFFFLFVFEVIEYGGTLFDLGWW
jgi:uncharacterized protein YqgC (DUF456 family)